MMDANFLLPVVAALAVGALVSPTPSLSANLLFLESILINVVLMGYQDSVIIGTSVLLSFFAMVMIGANYYLEVPHQNSKAKPSKFSIFIGAISIFSFWQNASRFSLAMTSNETLESMFTPSTMEILVAGFTLFSILVSAIFILDMKPKRDES